ncbi:MAG: sulfatase-like hydrolase/transferase, partial [Verrucomicrobiota bacterium]
MLAGYLLNIDSSSAGTLKPKIVFIIADDCTFRDIGRYGGRAYTPNMDRLASEGMRFTRCFQAAPTWKPYPLKSIQRAEHRSRPIGMPLAAREIHEQFADVPMTHDLSRVIRYNTDLYHRYMRQGYYASVTHADDLLGRILDKVTSLGLDENTYVVVLGDHGWLLGEHNEWAKNTLLHEALRPDSEKRDRKQAAKAASRLKKEKAEREAKVREILLEMSRAGLGKVIVAKLEEGMVGQQRQLNYDKRGFTRVAYLDLLALLGPDAVPVFTREAAREPNRVRQIATLIGPDIGDAIDAIIPERYDENTWSNKRYWLHYNNGLWPLAHAKPDPKHIPAFLDLVRKDQFMRQYHFRGVRLTGMLLSGMGDAPALPLARLLHDSSPQTRWAAATILEMIGPN